MVDFETPKTYSPQQLKELVKGKKWIFPYNELYAMYDEKNDIIELIEDYAPKNGLFAEGWRAFHFPRTSSLVISGKREGTKSIFLIKVGKTELNLKPAFAPIGIESVEVDKERDEVRIMYAGYGGGGVSACYCRGTAKGVKRVEIYQEGGGDKLGKAAIVLPLYRKIIIGVDDTDNEEEGATYTLVHNIAEEIADDKNIRYLTHVNAQLVPDNPNKTRNGMSTSLGFAVKKGFEERLVEHFLVQLKKETFSEHTGMVVFRGVVIPDEIKRLGDRFKREFITDMEMIKTAAKKHDINWYAVTGERGIIGAIAAIGLHDDPDYAASLIEK